MHEKGMCLETLRQEIAKSPPGSKGLFHSVKWDVCQLPLLFVG